VDVNGSSQSDGEERRRARTMARAGQTWPTHCGHAPERPSTANDPCQPANLKLARALNPASNARDTLVMRRSAVCGWKCERPPPNPP
jgi:hypothetical protein